MDRPVAVPQEVFFPEKNPQEIPRAPDQVHLGDLMSGLSRDLERIELALRKLMALR